MTPRHARLAATYLLLGLVATWAVAWGLAAGIDLSRARARAVGGGPQQQTALAVRSDAFGGTLVSVLRDYSGPTEGPGAPDTGRIPAGAATYGTDWVEARGWPMLALRCSIVGDDWLSPTSFKASDAIAIPSNRPFGFTALPLSPFWPGLIANTLFYAVLCCALHQLAGLARRRHRRTRARCPGCNYSREGLATDTPCPECGSNP